MESSLDDGSTFDPMIDAYRCLIDIVRSSGWKNSATAEELERDILGCIRNTQRIKAMVNVNGNGIKDVPLEKMMEWRDQSIAMFRKFNDFV